MAENNKIYITANELAEMLGVSVGHVKKDWSRKWTLWWNVNYIRNQKPLQQRKNGKKLDRSIWTGGEYRPTFDGNSSLNAI